MKVRSLVVISLFLSVCAFCPAQDGFGHEPGMGSSRQLNFSIAVNTSQNRPASNARVELRDVTNGHIVTSGYTNNMGIVELSGVPSGAYEFVVTQGLSEVQERRELDFGDQTMHFRLPASSETTAGNSDTVSVAQYKVSGKARNEYNKAQSDLHKGKADDASKHLAKALQIYPNFAEALTLRAILSMGKNDSQSAISDLDAAIKADPSYATAYFAMGATFNVLNRYDDALRTLNEGVSLSPLSWQAYFEMGKAHIGKGEYKEGIADLNKAQSLTTMKYPALHLVKAHAMLAMKDYPGAMLELQQFLTEAPNDARSVNARAALQQVSAFVAK